MHEIRDLAPRMRASGLRMIVNPFRSCETLFRETPERVTSSVSGATKQA